MLNGHFPFPEDFHFLSWSGIRKWHFLVRKGQDRSSRPALQHVYDDTFSTPCTQLFSESFVELHLYILYLIHLEVEIAKPIKVELHKNELLDIFQAKLTVSLKQNR